MDDVIVINCLWCSEPGFSDRHIQQFMSTDRCDQSPLEWINEANSDLCSCFDCVEEYHRSLNSLIATSTEDTSKLKSDSYFSNVDRLSSRFSKVLEAYSHNMPDDDCSESLYQLKFDLEVSMLELLSYPRLLLDSTLCDQFVNALELLVSGGLQIEVTRANRKLPGVYLLLVHPNEVVRRWCVRVVRSLGPVDWEEYDELEEAIHWLINVVLFDMFSDPQSDTGSAAWNESEILHLPTHLYSESRKDFWVGLCMLITSLDSTCVRSKLMSSRCGHPELLESILETLRTDHFVFMPLLKCLSVLLERLGFRFWQFVNTAEPRSVCQDIFHHPVFHQQIDQMHKSRHEEERDSSDEMSYTCSQLVYQHHVQSKDTDMECDEMSQAVIFSWIVPFIQSLLEFGPCMKDVICAVFREVTNLLVKRGSGPLSPHHTVLYFEVITILLGMVRMLYLEKAHSVLLQFEELWLSPLVKSLRLGGSSLKSEVAGFFERLLKSRAATQLPETAHHLSYFQQSLNGPSKRTLNFVSLSHHLVIVLKCLIRDDSVSDADMHSGESSTSTSQPFTVKTEPVDHSLNLSDNKHLQVDVKPVKLVKTVEKERLDAVKVKGVSRPKQMQSIVKTEGTSMSVDFLKKRIERTSVSEASTDELDESEYGPLSLRKRMLKSPKQLSLKHRSKLVVYKETPKKAKSPKEVPTPRTLPDAAAGLPVSPIDLSTPSLSPASSSDGELPSLRTLMTTPTKASKRVPTANMPSVPKPNLKTESEKTTSGGASRKVVSSSSGSTSMPRKKMIQTKLFEASPSKQQYVEPVLNFSRNDSTDKDRQTSRKPGNDDARNIASLGSDEQNTCNTDFMLCLSQEEMSTLDYFSEEEPSTQVLNKELDSGLADDGVKGLDKCTDDDAVQVTEKKEKCSYENQGPVPPERYISPPDSQTESTFEFCDFTDPSQEGKSSRDNEEKYEDIFQAFAAQRKSEANMEVSEDKDLQRAKPKTQESVSSANVPEACDSKASTSSYTDDEDLQTMFMKKAEHRRRQESKRPDSPMEWYSELSFISSPEDCSQHSVRADRFQSPDTSTNMSPSLEKIHLSPVTVDVVRLSKQRVQNLLQQSKSEERTKSATVGERKRKRPSPEEDLSDISLSANHQVPKKPKLDSGDKFLSARKTILTNHAPPKVIEPPGLKFSDRKAVLQETYSKTASKLKPTGGLKAARMSSKTKAPTTVKKPFELATQSIQSSSDNQSISKPDQTDSTCADKRVTRREEHLSNDSGQPSNQQAAGLQHYVPRYSGENRKDSATQDKSTSSIPSSSSSTTFKPMVKPSRPSQFQPAFGNKLSKSTQNLMSSLSSSSPMILSPQQTGPTATLAACPSPTRPPPPSRPAQPHINTRPTRLKTMDELYVRVLSWDPNVFLFPEQDEKRRKICPPCCEDLVREVKQVPLSFLSYDEYFSVFAPLFFMELWETIFDEVSNPSKYNPPPCHCAVVRASPQSIRVKTIMPSNKAREYAHPNERNLVIVHSGEAKCFGLVQNHKHTDLPNRECEVLIDLMVCCQPGFCYNSCIVKIDVVLSLTNEIRQWTGLINFHTSLLTRDLLYPRGREYFCHTLHHQHNIQVSGDYNPGQRESIVTAAQAMCAQYAQPRVLLLQGPPGTGKTHTITGIIQEGFKELQKVCQTSQPSSLPGRRGTERRKPHLLVCAPSNAAVDEIIRKLIKDGVVVNNSSGKAATRGLTVVRIGVREKINPQIIPFSLDVQAKDRIKSASKQESANSSKLDELRQQILTIDKKLDDAQKMELIQSTVHKAQPNEEVRQELQQLRALINELNKEKSELSYRHKKLRSQCAIDKRDQSKIRKRILVDADIVCATLCGSGSTALWECVRGLPRHFDCVIVDEASQCTELDILVPLRYRSSKLILVGDPLQLPATVRSKQAEMCGYGQSLFERLYKLFTETNRENNPVKKLNVQYRMLPEICCFPSQHFYSGQLQTDSSVGSSGNSFMLNPFLMFDVNDGIEESKDGSMRNIAECECLLALLEELQEQRVRPFSIGVITPYKAQEKHIRSLVRNKLSDVDIGTVDGFQGREKDIVVLSCVRANSLSGSIGFLCNRNRLNVALTRAKRALYVLGHLKTLQAPRFVCCSVINKNGGNQESLGDCLYNKTGSLVDRDWASLIQHAENCNAIVQVSDQRRDVTHILKRNGHSELLKYAKSSVHQNHSTPPNPNPPMAVDKDRPMRPVQSSGSILKGYTQRPKETKRVSFNDCPETTTTATQAAYSTPKTFPVEGASRSHDRSIEQPTIRDSSDEAGNGLLPRGDNRSTDPRRVSTHIGNTYRSQLSGPRDPRSSGKQSVTEPRPTDPRMLRLPDDQLKTKIMDKQSARRDPVEESSTQFVPSGILSKAPSRRVSENKTELRDSRSSTAGKQSVPEPRARKSHVQEPLLDERFQDQNPTKQPNTRNFRQATSSTVPSGHRWSTTDPRLKESDAQQTERPMDRRLNAVLPRRSETDRSRSIPSDLYMDTTRDPRIPRRHSTFEEASVSHNREHHPQALSPLSRPILIHTAAQSSHTRPTTHSMAKQEGRYTERTVNSHSSDPRNSDWHSSHRSNSDHHNASEYRSRKAWTSSTHNVDDLRGRAVIPDRPVKKRKNSTSKGGSNIREKLLKSTKFTT